MKPTAEQQKAIEMFKTERMLKVNACAGSGKSSTLLMMAAGDETPSLYLAFNRVVRDEAEEKFPDHVACKTTHQLAFYPFGRDLKHKMNRSQGKDRFKNMMANVKEISKAYRISDWDTGVAGEDVLKNTTIAALSRATVNKYEQSSDQDMSSKHIPHGDVKKILKARPSMDKNRLLKEVLKYAKCLWEDRIDVHSPAKITHDTYLKLYQLSNPKIKYKVIYLDEAQDANDAILDVLLKQTDSKIVLVGDSFQSIYAFRGAVNAMEKVECPSSCLTKSFRYGQAIADAATAVIDGGMEIKGLETIHSSMGVNASLQGSTMLFRTNIALIQTAVELFSQGYAVSCEVDTKDFSRMLQSGLALYKGKAVKSVHETIAPYSTWKDLKEAAKEEVELRRLVKLVESGDVHDFLDSLDSIGKKEDADIILTTAHKSKGREWDHVVLADDFPPPNEETQLLPDQERNLLYVAATRAIKTLHPNKTLIEMIENYKEKL